MKLAFGDNCETILKTAKISDPDSVKKILTCTNVDEFFGTGRFRRPDAKKARKERATKVMNVVQLIVANVGTTEESQSPRYSALHIQEMYGLLTELTQRNCHETRQL